MSFFPYFGIVCNIIFRDSGIAQQSDIGFPNFIFFHVDSPCCEVDIALKALLPYRYS
ncbi:hypothetical protein D1AOALGA4SA_3423 [Olavius algarvensis Delta 1 endosymbiont]|nr:hypothetical protein D1AOALGA4SA_3423 [Olavius algarvensis Delta 1 endosymbiont]